MLSWSGTVVARPAPRLLLTADPLYFRLLDGLGVRHRRTVFYAKWNACCQWSALRERRLAVAAANTNCIPASVHELPRRAGTRVRCALDPELMTISVRKRIHATRYTVQEVDACKQSWRKCMSVS